MQIDVYKSMDVAFVAYFRCVVHNSCTILKPMHGDEYWHFSRNS